MIKAADIINHFAQMESVPVEVEEVFDELVKRGVKDKIWLWEVEMASKHLRGKLVHWEPWEYPEGAAAGDDTACVADIYVSNELPIEWQRLVVVKELLHVIDPPECRVNIEADIQRLIELIGLPAEAQDPIADGIQVASDRWAIYEALAVLFPWNSRELFIEPFKAHKLTITDISRMVDLPFRYVSVVMNDVWPEAYPALIE